MSNSLFLGVDGGGTNTRARIVGSDGVVLGEGTSGSSNLVLGVDVAAGAIDLAIERAMAAAGIAANDRSRIHAGLGLAGGNVPTLAEAIAAHPFGFRSVSIASDAVTACLGAHNGGDGAILILGTGSQGLVISDGKATTVGGWGFYLSDDGSGAVLGMAALRRAILSFDSLAEETALTRELRAGHGNDPAAMALWARQATPRDYAALAPAIFAAAAAGDAAGLDLIGDAAGRVATLLDRLVALGAQRISLTGGLAGPYRRYLDRRFDPLLCAPHGDALAGALALARSGSVS